MSWKLNSDRPIYYQLLEQIQMRIVSGQYLTDSKLPSVRELAADAGVNPNTMQRAFIELERSGLIQTRRTAGRYVTEDESMIQTIRKELAKEQIQLFFENMKQLGYERTEIITLLESMIEEGSHEQH